MLGCVHKNQNVTIESSDKELLEKHTNNSFQDLEQTFSGLQSIKQAANGVCVGKHFPPPSRNTSSSFVTQCTM